MVQSTTEHQTASAHIATQSRGAALNSSRVSPLLTVPQHQKRGLRPNLGGF